MPAECRLEVDQPVERRELPKADEAPCQQADHDEWVACVVEKARRIVDTNELNHGDKVLERRRRKACVDFIDAELPPPPP